jgi:hypothetical protein
MRMHEHLRRSSRAAFAPPDGRRLYGQRGCHGWGSNLFLQGGAGKVGNLRADGEQSGRSVTTNRELASVTNGIGGDLAVFVRARAF